VPDVAPPVLDGPPSVPDAALGDLFPAHATTIDADRTVMESAREAKVEPNCCWDFIASTSVDRLACTSLQAGAHDRYSIT
jgi:hypothetical protein